MLLDLTQIRQPEIELIRRYEPSAFEGPAPSEGKARVEGRNKEFRVIAPVDLQAKVYKDKDRFRIVGRVSTTLELACSRCLEPFQLPVDSSFDLRYLPHGENTGDEREVEEDDLSAAFYRDDAIDLRQMMEEQFYLALPMKPLCRSDCKGLCPNCGTNLNVAACDCQVRWEDPRLAGLKALLTERKDDA